MASKNIGKLLSDGALVLCVILLCALNTGVYAIEGQRVTYTISGSTGIGGVTMKGLPNNPVTDASGNYSVVVDYGWKGTVRPELAGYTFEPSYKNYPKVTSNQIQDYIATIEQYTISGIVRMDGAPMEGVVIEGLPGAPTTGSNGTYEASVPYDWGGMIIPSKDGYVFTPNNIPLSSVTRNMPNQNFTGAVITYEISGSVGVEGVVMNGLPGNPTSDSNGNYSAAVKFEWSGTVRPKKDGYTFEPVEMPYEDVISAYPNQDYFANAIMFTISGSAGMDGVEMKGFPGDIPVYTDMDGFYSVNVPWGWSGTVRPDKPGYKFEDPATFNYTKVTSDTTEQNYTPAPIILTISGSVGMEGVTMDGLPDNPVTGAGGSFTANVPWGWTGMVTPMIDGYEFTPASKPYTNITTDQTNQRFVAKQITYTISGTVGVAGATLNGAPGRVISGSDGSYTAVVPYGWSGTITPMKSGYTFNPADMTYSSLLNDEVNQDYYAALEKRIISGTIRSDKGDPVEGVFVIADPGGGSDETDAYGMYQLSVDHGWRGTLTPTRVGHDFRPPTKRQMSPVTKDLENQNFNAIIQTFTISDVVRVGGTPIEGVKVTANNGGGEAVTNAAGRFTVEVPYDWSGEIELEMEGFIFEDKPYANITQDMVGDMTKAQYEAQRRGFGEPTTAPDTTPRTDMRPTLPPDDTTAFTTAKPGAITPPAQQEPEEELTETQRILQQLEALLNKQQQPVVIEPNEIIPDMPLISNIFVDEDIIDALNTIATTADITIIPDETVVGSVNCRLDNVPLDTALEIVLAGTPYIVKKTPYYYLVCSAGIADSQFVTVSETHRVTMSYITADAAVGLLSSAFTDYVKAEVGPPGTSTYTVVVTAPPAIAQRIMEDLRKIDRLPSQVLLDARIVVMESGDLLNMGIQWGMPKMYGGYFTSELHNRGGTDLLDLGGKIAGGITIGYTPDATFTDSLLATLNLLAEDDELTIMAQPQVMAQDGKAAQINVTTEEYYMLTSPDIGAIYYTRTEMEKIESGTKLNITPHIGDNNDITLDLAVEVSDSIPQGRGNDLPVVTRRTATNTVSIRNGGTVAVAGLTENKTRLSKQRVPGLSSLPLIGGLFKNKNDTKADREIAVFVTAYIIPQSSRPIELAQPQMPPVQAQPPLQGQMAPEEMISDRMPSSTRIPGSRIIAPGSRRTIPERPMERSFKTQLRDSLSRPVR